MKQQDHDAKTSKHILEGALSLTESVQVMVARAHHKQKTFNVALKPKPDVSVMESIGQIRVEMVH